MEAQLKQACQMTGAKWAALAERQGGQWIIHTAYRLSKSKQAALKNFLAQESIDIWLVGVLNGKNNRAASLPLDAKLDAAKLYVFTIPEASRALLVGGNRLSASHQGVWRLVSGLIASDRQTVDNDFLSDIQAELSYDTPRDLDRVLASFVQIANPQGAWLAIRRGDVLDIVTQFNDTHSVNLSLSIDFESIPAPDQPHASGNFS